MQITGVEGSALQFFCDDDRRQVAHVPKRRRQGAIAAGAIGGSTDQTKQQPSNIC
jgi:hypothetical protein